MSAGFIAACKKSSLRAVLFSLLIIATACGNQTASGGAPQASNDATQSLAAETEIPQPTPTPTEEAVIPLDKLLDPCALLPADEIEDLLGFPIYMAWRRSFMMPTMTQNRLEAHEPETERVLYDCLYAAFDKFEQEPEITLSVEVFSDPVDAQAQMEVFHEFYDKRLLQAEVPPLLPMVEISDLGDQAYSFVPQITTNPITGIPEGTPLGNYPIVYFLSGNYLVSINIWPSPLTNEDNQAFFTKALEFARNTLTALPADIHSAMAEQYYELDSPGQPAGKPFEPCELLTRDEAQQYMDESISIEESYSYWRNPPTYWSECIYRSFQSVVIGVDILSDGQLEYEISTYQDANFAEVSGIGERAFRNPSTQGTDIMVISGNTVISIGITNTSDSEAQFQSAFELAELVLSRLPKLE
jgi:hypothetical protein